MTVCYVAVPARLIGAKTSYSRRDELTATVVGGAIGAVVCTPFVLGRAGLLRLVQVNQDQILKQDHNQPERRRDRGGGHKLPAHHEETAVYTWRILAHWPQTRQSLIVIRFSVQACDRIACNDHPCI